MSQLVQPIERRRKLLGVKIFQLLVWSLAAAGLACAVGSLFI